MSRMIKAEWTNKDSLDLQPTCNNLATDTISRQAALGLVSYDEDFTYEEILKLPSAQPEIIKCEDCKHFQKWRSEESAKKFGQIYECERGILMCPLPDDFCSMAERQEE